MKKEYISRSLYDNLTKEFDKNSFRFMEMSYIDRAMSAYDSVFGDVTSTSTGLLADDKFYLINAATGDITGIPLEDLSIVTKGTEPGTDRFSESGGATVKANLTEIKKATGINYDRTRSSGRELAGVELMGIDHIDRLNAHGSNGHLSQELGVNKALVELLNNNDKTVITGFDAIKIAQGTEIARQQRYNQTIERQLNAIKGKSLADGLEGLK